MPGPDGRFLKGEHWRQERPHWRAEWLSEQYTALGRSTGEIAAETGTTDAAILYWLKKHGIARRDVSGARALKHWGVSGTDNPMSGKVGSANPRYIDGSSPERQRLYAQGEGREFLRSILKRDDYRCRRCGKGKDAPKSLHVHHVTPWAGNAALRFDPHNAVTLCRPCHQWVHSKANLARDFLA